MPFKSQNKCASESNHEQWEIHTSPSTVLKVKVPARIRDKLLDLCGKSMSRNYSKSNPRFCDECISKVQELHPELEGKRPSSSPDFGHFKRQREDTGTDDESDDLPGPVTEASSEGQDRININVAALTANQRQHLAFELGKYESRDSKRCALNLSRCRDLDTLLSLDCREPKETNETVKAFLSGISQPQAESSQAIQGSFLTANKAYQLYKSVESVLNLSAVNLSLPAHFRESVILYTLTGSKLALRILGSGGAHASYNSVKAWLSNLASIQAPVPNEDMIAAFDNNQVLQRRWKVKLRNEVQCNIVTVVVFFEISKAGTLQHRAELKPEMWSNKTLSEDEIQRLKYLDQTEDIKATHYKHLYPFVQSAIEKVANEQTKDGEKLTDPIDKNVEIEKRAKAFKTCYNCNFQDVPKSRHTCPQCKANLTKAKMKAMGIDENGMAIQEGTVASQDTKEYRVFLGESTGERTELALAYERQGQDVHEYSIYMDETHESSANAKVHVQEPVYVNPCSYDAVATVLRNIGHRAGIKQYGGNREWLIVTCDGVPFNLGRRIIQSYHTCSACSISLNGLDACATHENEVHPNEAVSFSLEFNWVVLQPGMGHIEMNMVKGATALAWDVFWKEMAICFNFRSEAALKCCKKVTDHHKGWTLCRIARQAITEELVVPYVRQEMTKEHPSLSPAAFMKYCMNAENPNYTFLCDFTFEILDSIFMYRAGVRGGMVDFMKAGRSKFAKLWSGRHHPLYRELEMADSLLTARMPPEVLDLVTSSSSINLSGKPFTGEGADFRLEEVNQQVQQWLPNIPTAKDWKIACCNFDQLSTFRSQVFEQMGVTDPKHQSTKYTQNIDDEITAFRTRLRTAEYLSFPNERRPHVGLNGTSLDKELHLFCERAREKRAKYTERYLEYEVTANILRRRPPPFKEHPVFITPEERQKFQSVENRTIAELKHLVQEDFKSLTDEDMKEALESVWEEVCRKPNKGMILDFYYELQEHVNALNPFTDILSQNLQEEA